MPSWNDGESSTEWLSDSTDMAYAPRSPYAPAYTPETWEDISFSGIAVGAERCRVHGLEPTRCVAFEGTQTGRKFHKCSVRHEVNNCGFVRWVDGEWPESLQNSLRRLWAMYHELSDTRIEEKLQNAKLVQELVEERDKFKKNYYSLMDEVDKYMKDTAMKGNKGELESEIAKLKEDNKRLEEDNKRLEEEKVKLKDEKKNAEYMLHDLFKVSSGNKEKLLKIKQLVGEI